MTGRSGLLVASAAVCGLILLGFPTNSAAQSMAVPSFLPVGQTASFAPGSIHGVVRNEKDAPVAGAMVTAQGAQGMTALAVTDRDGRFELQALPPGSYVLRARLKGYLVSAPRTAGLAPNERAAVSLSIRSTDAPAVLAAGLGGAGLSAPESDQASEPEKTPAGPAEPGEHSETAWRVRHVRRSVLREIDTIEGVLAADAPRAQPTLFESVDWLGRAVVSPARIATNYIADTPFSAQVNFLTAGSLDDPTQLFTIDNLSRGVAYVSLGAPAGAGADWTVQGALTEADVASWIVAGSYASRGQDTHRYGLGMSYSTQRYDAGSPLPLHDPAEVTRRAGEFYGYDTVGILPDVLLTYGARYTHYDYLDRRALVSPRIEVTAAPGDGLRLNAVWSQRAHAPGAEEFLPPGESGIWLPPQRTFSSLEPGLPFQAERASRFAIELERDLDGSTFAVRAFREQVDDQLLTLFGASVPGRPAASIGHYYVANIGDLKATGCAAEFRTKWTDRLRGSVTYALARARLDPGTNLHYVIMLAPSAVRSEPEQIHDLSTTVEADVPETSTRVLVVYRANSAFVQPARVGGHGEGERRGFDSRFDVQVRQHLPFMNFSSAKVEMLVAVRNFFRDAEGESSAFGELFVGQPPKRIVGGVALQF